MLPLINQHLCVDQLIREVLDAQEGKQAIGDDLVDAFVADDAFPGVIVGQLVIDLAVRPLLIGFEKGTGCPG